MKKCVMVGYDEEKLCALKMYAQQKSVSIEEELVQTLEALYQKVVPSNVRFFLDMKAENQKPKKGRQPPSVSAVAEAPVGE